MPWNSSLETGLAKIDEQHRELYRQAELLLESGNEAIFSEILEFIDKYLRKHFRDEQLLHSVAKYPRAAACRQSNSEFLSKFRRMKEAYNSAEKKRITAGEINTALISWLKWHIEVELKDFAVFYLYKPELRRRGLRCFQLPANPQDLMKVFGPFSGDRSDNSAEEFKQLFRSLD